MPDRAHEPAREAPDLPRGPAPGAPAPRAPERREGLIGGRRAVWHEAVPASGQADAPTLLLIHGGGADAAMVSWALTLRAYPAYRVIAPDLPGYGGTARVRGAHTIEGMAAWVGDLCDAIGLAPGAVAGVSMGGAIAITLALDAPERVRALVPIAAFGLGGATALPRRIWFASRLPLAGMAFTAAAGSDHWARRMLSNVYADPARITPEMVAASRIAARRQVWAPAFGAFLRHEIAWRRFRTDLMPRLPGIRQPTLFVHGTADRLVPIRASRAAQHLVPGARLAEIEGAGHVPMREAPDAFHAALGGFLDRLA